MRKKRILLGVVTTMVEKDFLNSYTQLLADNKNYEITPRFIWNHPVVIGNNMLAEECIKDKYDYLMLVSRQYHGFNIDMLHSMVKSKADVSTVRYRYTNFPFTHMPMDHEIGDDHKLLSVNEKTGNREVKFAGLDFCLIKRSILEKLDTPYFRECNGDNLIHKSHFDFSSRVREVGGKVIGCLDHYIPHEFISDNIHTNIREVYDFMNNKKKTVEDYRKEGKVVREEYDKMIATPLTDTQVHIFTPSARPQNIKLINESIYRAEGPHNLAINWHIMYKNHDNKFNIIPNYNKYLDAIKTGWFTFMCDDNMFHPGLFKAFSDTLDKNPNMGVYVVGIIGHKGAVQMAGPQFCKPFHSDASQYFFNREVLGDLRFATGEMAHGADGQLLQDLYAQCPDKFIFDNRIIAYHEALKVDGFRGIECYSDKDVPKQVQDEMQKAAKLEVEKELQIAK